jgi:hypothetical protein
MTAIECLLDILEYPDIEKGYIKLKNYYIQSNRKQDAEAIEHLIQKRFANASTNNNKE